MQAGRSAGELLSAAPRKAAEGIIFDLGDSGAAAPFRATSHGSRNIGVGIAGRSWVLSQKAFQKIENPLEVDRLISASGIDAPIRKENLQTP